VIASDAPFSFISGPTPLIKTEKHSVHWNCRYQFYGVLPEQTSIAPHLALMTMQEIRQHVLVGHTGRGRAQRMDIALFGVHADVRFIPKYHCFLLHV
jgi:hypothetical protein